jgi:hypothetical protein
MAMSISRVVILAVVLEGRSNSEVARDYGVSRRWVQKLVARYELEGEAAFEPHSRRPRSNPRRISAEFEEAIISRRKTLTGSGLAPARRRSLFIWARPGSQRRRWPRSGGSSGSPSITRCAVASHYRQSQCSMP